MKQTKLLWVRFQRRRSFFLRGTFFARWGSGTLFSSPHMEERPLPTDADVEAVVTERLTALLEARLRERDSLQTDRSLRFIRLARELADNEDESALIAMLLDDYYQQMLHAPPPRPSEEPAPAPAESRREETGRPDRNRRGRSRRRR